MAHDAMPATEVGSETATRRPHPLTLKKVLVVTGDIEEPSATVTVVVNGRHETRQHSGRGPVDALFKAINEAVGGFARSVELTSYSVRSRGKGTDARGYVKVCLERHGQTCVGAYTHVDILVASAHAYIHALRKLDL